MPTKRSYADWMPLPAATAAAAAAAAAATAAPRVGSDRAIK